MTKKYLSCDEVLKELYTFLDGETDAELSEQINEHIHRCQECYGRAGFEKRLKERVAETGEQKAPDDVRSKLKSIIGKL